MHKVQEALRHNRYREKSKDTIEDIMNRFLDEQEEDGEIKVNSMLRKRITARLISTDMKKIAQKKIQKVTAEEINEEFTKLANTKNNKGQYKYSQSYIDKVYSVLKEVYKMAVVYNIIHEDDNFFKIEGKIRKKKSKKETKEVIPFNRNECILFLKQLSIEDDEYRDVFYVLIWTGMRIGECLALKTKNILLEENKIRIEVSITKNNKDKTVIGKSTKTKSTRTIPLTQNLRDILEPRMNKNDPEALIFSHDNNIIATSTINTHFKNICSRANIRVDVNGKINANTHMLRHLAASIAVKVGVETKRSPTTFRS